MKNFFVKKYNNLILFLIISIASIIIPSSIVLAVVPDPTRWVDTETKGKPLSGGKPTPERADGTQRYAEPTSFEGNGVVIKITSSSGTQTAYTVYNTSEDARIATEKGVCYGTCISASEAGLTGTDRKDWDKQIENASNKEKSNGKDLDLSSPFSLWQARETLRLDGYDVDNMTAGDIFKAANDIIHTNGNFSEADYSAFSIAVKQSWPLEYYLCTSGSGGDCEAAAAEGFAINVKDVVWNGMWRTKSDEGGVCSIDDCPDDCTDSCCPGDPGYPSCDSGDDDDGDKTPYEWPSISAGSCDVNIPDVPSPSPKPIPENTFTGGSCGSTAVKTTYEASSAGCGYVTLLTTTKVTAQLPAAPGIVYAGKGFNWGGVSSAKNVSVKVYDVGALQAAMMQKQLEIQGYSAAIGCLEKELAKLEADYAAAMAECNKIVESECNACTKPCENYSCNEQGPDAGEKCDPPVCDCASYCDHEAKCQYLTDDYNLKTTRINEQIKGYRILVDLAAKELQRLAECGQSAYSATGVTSETGTVSIVNQKMNLGNKYTQVINSIKGVIKNSGLELTAADIEEYEDTETYLKVDTNFFVPYYIKNGTQGNVNGDIVGDISIPGYSCPLNVTNNILCKDDDCLGTSNLDLIYRPISLSNPFPNTKNQTQYRAMGSNWNNLYAEQFITKNRNVEDYNIYSLTPVYTITLTPSDIKDIRSYNKQNSLNDFDMDCSEGYKCVSKFLWEKFVKLIDTSESCASATGWDTTCYRGGASE